MTTMIQRDQTTGADMRVVPPTDCAHFCTKPEHREPVWDSLFSYGEGTGYEATSWCSHTIGVVKDQIAGLEDTEVTITVGVERAQFHNLPSATDSMVPTVQPAVITLAIDGGKGLDELSPQAWRRLAQLGNVAADLIEYHPTGAVTR